MGAADSHHAARRRQILGVVSAAPRASRADARRLIFHRVGPRAGSVAGRLAMPIHTRPDPWARRAGLDMMGPCSADVKPWRRSLPQPPCRSYPPARRRVPPRRRPPLPRKPTPSSCSISRRQPASPGTRDRHLARASTPARGPRCDPSSPTAPAAGQQRIAQQLRADLGASTPSTPAACRTRRAPASRSCAAPTRRRSRASRFRTATSPSAAGATRRMSSSRTSARTSTSRAFSTATTASRTPPTPRRTSRGCSRTRSSSTASSAACRRRAAAGLVPPAFLIDKAMAQMTLSAKNAREGGTLVESIERRTKNIPGDWAERARTIAAQEIAPALERQIARAAGAAGRRHERRRDRGAAARRGVLPLGPQGVDDHECRRTRSTSWAGASWSGCTRRWTRSSRRSATRRAPSASG